MIRSIAVACVGIFWPAETWGQVVPAHPGRFVTRPVGPVSPGPGVTVVPRNPEPKVRQVTYLILSEERQWLSTEGKQVTGKLIAFEEVVVEGVKGDVPLPQPALPSHPTVVREGKVRLLVNRKASEVPLERLVEPDREFVEKVRLERKKR